MNEALEETDGLIIAGERITVNKYSDDWVVLASSEKDLQKMTNRIVVA